MVNTIVFDLGNVLVEWQPAKFLLQVCHTRSESDMVLREVFTSSDWLKVDEGTWSWERAIEEFALRCDLSSSRMKSIMNESMELLHPLPDSIAFLNQVRQKGYKAYCLSNISKHVMDLLVRRHDFFDLFHGRMASGEVGLLKPNPAIYHLICERFKIIPAETVFIDDRPENVAAAKKIGMYGIEFREINDCIKQFQKLI